MKTLECTMCILAISPFSAEINELKEKRLGYILCILAFSSFSAHMEELKMKKKTRMQFVRASFFFLQLTGSAAVSEVKADKARMHIVHPGFCILQLTQSAEITK